MRQLLEVDISSSIQQRCSVKNEFDYFAGGCFTDRPTPLDYPATGDRQFNKQKQYQVQKAEDGTINVAVDVLKKS
jgi:hypothetical protein